MGRIEERLEPSRHSAENQADGHTDNYLQPEFDSEEEDAFLTELDEHTTLLD